jgi:hypothetical protein
MSLQYANALHVLEAEFTKIKLGKSKIKTCFNCIVFPNITYTVYRKPPTISPGLIYFRKRFLTGLYKGGGLIYGWAYTWTIFCVSNKQVRQKQVSHKQGNKCVLSRDYWVYINWGTYIRGAYIRVGLYSGGGLIFGMM